MTLSEQSAILLEAIKDELLQPEDIVRWADGIIVAMDKPPSWIIELSTLGSPHMADFDSRLREQTSLSLPIHHQIQVVVLARDAGLIPLSGALQKLCRITMLERGQLPMDVLETQLHGLLVQWCQQDDLVVIGPQLKAKLEAVFRVYLKDAADIKSLLPWRFGKAA